MPQAGKQDHIREERRDVTVVFADLVGSTALGERLDSEELKFADLVGRPFVAVGVTIDRSRGSPARVRRRRP